MISMGGWARSSRSSTKTLPSVLDVAKNLFEGSTLISLILAWCSLFLQTRSLRSTAQILDPSFLVC